VTSASGLEAALNAAWGLNRHSVVEVTTRRDANVDHHRAVQRQVMRAVQAAYRLLVPDCRTAVSSSRSSFLAPAVVIRGLIWSRFELPLVKPLTVTATALSSAVGGASNQHGLGAREGLVVTISLGKEMAGKSLTDPAGSDEISVGSGEISPLPGLHRESLEEAERQLALVSELLRGKPVPRTVAMLGGRLGLWLRDALGFDPERLCPSVRWGLETALLSALAEERGTSLASLLADSSSFGEGGVSESVGVAGSVEERLLPDAPAGEVSPRPVLVNGLVQGASGPGGVDGAVAEAVRLVREDGCRCLKVKVARRCAREGGQQQRAVGGSKGPLIRCPPAVPLTPQSRHLRSRRPRRSRLSDLHPHRPVSPEQDAELLIRIRTAVGSSPEIRADANRGWTLDEALRFGRALRAAAAAAAAAASKEEEAVGLAFIEEPTEGPLDWGAFHEGTGRGWSP